VIRLRWEPCSRIPAVPLWALAIVGGWGLFVALAVGLQRFTGIPLDICLFRQLTGHPCPTCGSTRIVLGFLQGHGLLVARLNPGVWAALVGAAALLAVRVILGRRLRLEASALERRWLLVAGLVLVLLDWWWVLRHA
jgi:hypothetical protein